jgi:hypothetical protein
MSVDDFLGSLRLKAIEANKIRDSNWMADYLSACVSGPALAWYEELDEDTQRDWKKLRAALMAEDPIRCVPILSCALKSYIIYGQR